VGVVELHTEETTAIGGRSRRLTAFAVVVLVVSLAIGALSSLPALAGVTDPTDPPTTTEPAPDPTTTTEPAPDPTTTTEPAPDPTTTTEPAPDPTTTTEPAPDPTAAPAPRTPADPEVAAEAQAGRLQPSEALVPLPEFAALSGHQRALVQELQTASDLYALRRFALVDLIHQVATAKDALAAARTAENAALRREVLALAEATRVDDDVTASGNDALDDPAGNLPTLAAIQRQAHGAARHDLTAAVRALARPLEADRKNAQRARVQAQAAVAASSARLAEATKAVADALTERTATEAAIEHELGPDAVRARPDGITATLVAAQAGQPDPFVIAPIGQPIPGAALSSPFGLRNDPLSGGAGFHPGFDLTATFGTPIHAAAAGVVVIVGDCGGYGNCVVIDHGASLATLYAHQSQVFVGVGEHVDAAQVIGLVGATGLATGPHLHFEVRLRGLPIDPVLALPAG
jgi:murein DD-endopeptidase MepM/ murein hydrolase activator NlpD